MPQFYHLLKRDNNGNYFVGLLWKLSEFMYVIVLYNIWHIEKAVFAMVVMMMMIKFSH